MGVQEEVPFGELSHDQVTLPLTSSGSSRVAVSRISSTGCSDDSVTVPASSMLLTVMVTVMVSVPPAVSVAVTRMK